MQDFDSIETPENVELRRPLAGIGSRFIAGFLDNLLIVSVYLVLFALLLLADVNIMEDVGISNAAETWLLAVVILIGFSIYWGYFVFFEMWTNGQSPGKKYVKIRVVQVEGAGISFSSIAVRNLLRAVDGIGFYAVAGMAMFVTKKVQRLGDLAAGTVVISEELPDYSARYDKKRHILDDEGVTSAALEATGLTPEEYRLLRNYWLRREELSVEARGQLLPQLLRPVLKRSGLTPVDTSHAGLEKYLDQIMAKAKSAGRDSEARADSQEAGG